MLRFLRSYSLQSLTAQPLSRPMTSTRAESSARLARSEFAATFGQFVEPSSSRKRTRQESNPGSMEEFACDEIKRGQGLCRPRFGGPRRNNPPEKGYVLNGRPFFVTPGQHSRRKPWKCKPGTNQFGRPIPLGEERERYEAVHSYHSITGSVCGFSGFRRKLQSPDHVEQGSNG